MRRRKKKPQTFIRFRGTKEVWLYRHDEGQRVTLYDPAMPQHQLQSHLKSGWEVHKQWTNV